MQGLLSAHFPVTMRSLIFLHHHRHLFSSPRSVSFPLFGACSNRAQVLPLLLFVLLLFRSWGKMGKVTFPECCGTSPCPTIDPPRRTESLRYKRLCSSCVSRCSAVVFRHTMAFGFHSSSIPRFRRQKHDVHGQKGRSPLFESVSRQAPSCLFPYLHPSGI